MKLLHLILFLFLYQLGFSQALAPRIFPGKLADSSICIFQIEIVDLIPVDSLHNEVRKARVEKLINYLAACDRKYSFDAKFKDKEFRLIIPKYLSHVSYELGDQHFGISLNDTTSSQSTILFSYDLDDSYKKHFLAHDNEGFKKSGIIELNGQKIHLFKNWDDRIAGTIFCPNHMEISYFTKSKKLEHELQDAICKFSW